MRRLTQILHCLSIAVIAVGFAACTKTPTSPPTTTPAGPSITLTLPDSAALDAPVNMTAHLSQTLEQGWVFVWHFGDSTLLTTRDSTVVHIYLNSGLCKIEVDLVDTSKWKTLAQTFGDIRIGNGPTLTVSAPDSVQPGMALTVQVSSSLFRSPDWVYSWDWGDGTPITTSDNSKLGQIQNHVYQNPSDYFLRITLLDLKTGCNLSTRVSRIRVYPSQFSLAFLQSMHSVSVVCNGVVVTRHDYYGSVTTDVAVDSLVFGAIPVETSNDLYSLKYSLSSFVLDTVIQTTFGSSWSYVSLSALFDSSASRIRSFSVQDVTGAQYNGAGNSRRYSCHFEDVFFKSRSDSELVFAAGGQMAFMQPAVICDSSFIRSSSRTDARSIDSRSSSAIPRVTITFHK